MDSTHRETRRAPTAGAIASVIKNARRLTGWSQRELAARAGTSQSAICRLESGSASAIEMLVLGNVLDALGLDARLVIEGRHLLDRVRQNDGVHAKVTGFVGRRVTGWDWLTVRRGADRRRSATRLDRPARVSARGSRAPRRGDEDRSPRLRGAPAESLAFYEREAWRWRAGLGWEPRTVNVLVVALDWQPSPAASPTTGTWCRLAVPRADPRRPALAREPAAPRPRGWAHRHVRPGVAERCVAAPDDARLTSHPAGLRELRRCSGAAAPAIPLSRIPIRAHPQGRMAPGVLSRWGWKPGCPRTGHGRRSRFGAGRTSTPGAGSHPQTGMAPGVLSAVGPCGSGGDGIRGRCRRA